MSQHPDSFLLPPEEDAETLRIRAVAARLLAAIDPNAEPGPSYRRLLESAIKDAVDAQGALEKVGRELVRLRELSVTDDVTGALNRRGFRCALDRSLERARRHGEVGMLLLVDLDSFKQVNDTFGHTAGDLVPSSVATLLIKQCRKRDAGARLGGDEFAILLANTDVDNGTSKARSLGHALNSLVVPWQGKGIQVTASIGVESYNAQTDADQVMHKADIKMYRSKRSSPSQEQAGASSTWTRFARMR